MEWEFQVNGTRTLWWDRKVIGQVSRSVSHGGQVHVWLAFARRGSEWLRVGDHGEAEDAMDATEAWLIGDLDASVAE